MLYFTPYQQKKGTNLFNITRIPVQDLDQERLAKQIAASHARLEPFIATRLIPWLQHKNLWEITALVAFPESYCNILMEEEKPQKEQSFDRWRALHCTAAAQAYWPFAQKCVEGMRVNASTYQHWALLRKVRGVSEQVVFEGMAGCAENLAQLNLISFALPLRRYPHVRHLILQKTDQIASCGSVKERLAVRLLQIHLVGYA
ncbi:MAG: hypothetical protein WC045_01915 [Patescibacteria group bacterium]